MASPPSLTLVTEINGLSKILKVRGQLLELLTYKGYEVKENVSGFTTEEIEENPLLVRTYELKKYPKSLRTRTISVPGSVKIKSLLKLLAKLLGSLYDPPAYVHGYIKGRSISTNAQPHLAKQNLVKVDIENFFDNITKEKVYNCLLSLKVHPDIANLICAITVINDKLPQGFSTSPVLSNLVFQSADEEINSYAIKNNICYTRYADDLSLSSNQDLQLGQIQQIVERHGFKLNDKKSLQLKRGYYQTVTGLTVFDDKFPRIPKRTKRKLRLEVYYINRYGIRNHAIRRLVRSKTFNHAPNKEELIRLEINKIRNRIEGWISFSKGIEPQLSIKLSNTFTARND